MRLPLLTIAFCLLWGCWAEAQDTPTLSASVGYSYLRDFDVEEDYHGWTASATVPIHTWVSVTGEVGGNYATLPIGRAALKLRIHSFMAGAHFAPPGRRRMRPFARLLLGPARGSVRFEDEVEKVTSFAAQFGLGVDVGIVRNLSLRAGSDYRKIVTGRRNNEFLATLSMVIHMRTR